jgi:DNA polymerase-1
MSDAQCTTYTEQWKESFPEMRHYFARIGAMFNDDVHRASVETLFTERRRGGASYCAACNNGFQALGVDCAKAALCLVGEAEYCDRSSPLYGSRTVAFVHDEIIAETDDTPAAHDAAFALAECMVKGANRYLPDVPILMSKMEPTLMRAWSKEAKQVWKDGRLVPWAP